MKLKVQEQEETQGEMNPSDFQHIMNAVTIGNMVLLPLVYLFSGEEDLKVAEIIYMFSAMSAIILIVFTLSAYFFAISNARIKEVIFHTLKLVLCSILMLFTLTGVSKEEERVEESRQQIQLEESREQVQQDLHLQTEIIDSIGGGRL